MISDWHTHRKLSESCCAQPERGWGGPESGLTPMLFSADVHCVFPSRPSMSEVPCKKREDYLEWPEYFMAVAFLSAQRSKDPNSQVSDFRRGTIGPSLTQRCLPVSTLQRPLPGQSEAAALCAAPLCVRLPVGEIVGASPPDLGPGALFLWLVGTATEQK